MCLTGEFMMEEQDFDEESDDGDGGSDGGSPMGALMMERGRGKGMAAGRW